MLAAYLDREGLAVELVKVESVSSEDYLMQDPLVNGRLDASYHWFHHVVFGNRHNLPLKAVLKVCDSPGMKVLVANRLKDTVKSPADFKGRRIADEDQAPRRRGQRGGGRDRVQLDAIADRLDGDRAEPPRARRLDHARLQIDRAEDLTRLLGFEIDRRAIGEIDAVHSAANS